MYFHQLREEREELLRAEQDRLQAEQNIEIVTVPCSSDPVNLGSDSINPPKANEDRIVSANDVSLRSSEPKITSSSPVVNSRKSVPVPRRDVHENLLDSVSFLPIPGHIVGCVGFQRVHLRAANYLDEFELFNVHRSRLKKEQHCDPSEANPKFKTGTRN